MAKFITIVLASLLFVLSPIYGLAQSSEEELKEKAEELFEEQKYEEALPLFSQILALYPKDPNYNYKFGACQLFAGKDKEEPLKYLQFAVSKPNVEAAAYYFMGRAYHLNYQFDKALEFYKKFKDNAKGKVVERLDVEQQIKMCNSGQNLLSIITDIIVLERNTLNEEDFFRSYNTSTFGGKLIVKPDEFKSDYEEKKGIRTIMYLPDNQDRVYFSRIEGKSKSGKDIYYADKKLDGSWGEAVKIEGPVNTDYDEDFPFLHPDGNVLYFASKGHNSMGGYDIFRSFYNSETKSWGEPVNLDFAINTPSDDYFILTDKEQKTAYFTSNRFLEAGKVNVYHIEMERVPLDVAIIKGKFTAPFTKNAKITVQNLYDNSIVAEFNTDPNNGEYKVEVPNTGKFRFLVEAEKSSVTHSGVVELKNQDAFKPVIQNMEIQGTGDAEKLVIRNLIGEEAQDDEPVLTAAMLKRKAQLEVNSDRERPKPKVTVLEEAEETTAAEEVAQNEASPSVVTSTQREQSAQPKKEVDLSTLSDEELVDLAYEDAAELKREADDLFAKSSLAMKIAEEKNQEAREKKAEANRLSLEAQKSGTTTNEERKAVSDLREEAVTAKRDAEVAFNLAKELDVSAKRKARHANDAQTYAQTLKDILENDPSDAERDRLLTFRDSLEIIHGDVEITEGDIAYKNTLKELARKEQELAGIEQKKSATERELTSVNAELDRVNLSLESAKGSEKSALSDKKQALEAKKNNLNQEADAQNLAFEETQEEVLNLREEKKVLEDILAKVGSTVPQEYSEEAVASLDKEIEDFDKNDYDRDTFENDLVGAETSASVTQNATGTTSTGAAQESTLASPTGSANASDDKYDFKLEYETSETNLSGTEGNEQTEEEDPFADEEQPLVDPFTDLADAQYADTYLEDLNAAENAPGTEKDVAAAKGAVYDEWYQKLDNEAFALKLKMKKTKNEEKKAELQTQIDVLESQRDEVRALANNEYQTAVAGGDEASLPKGELSTKAFNKSLENQSLTNIVKSSYHQEYADEFTAAIDIPDDFVRAYKTKDINERWLNEIGAEIASLEEQERNAPTRQEQQLIAERISNLEELQKVKAKELASNKKIMSEKVEEPFSPSANASVSPNYARIDELSRESKNFYKNAIALEDSARKAKDEGNRESLLADAKLYENRAFERMQEVAQLTQQVNSFQNENSNMLAFRSDKPITDNRSELLASASNNPAIPNAQAPSAPAYSYAYNSPEVPVVPNAEEFQNVAAQLEGDRAKLEQDIAAESDPEKKKQLQKELSVLDDKIERSTRAANVLIELDEKRKASSDKALSMDPSQETLESSKQFSDAEILYQEVRDSLAYANFLKDQAASTSDEAEKQKYLSEAAVITERTASKRSEADVLFSSAVSLRNSEAQALGNRKIKEADVSTAYPEINKELTAAQAQAVESSALYQQYNAKNQEAIRLFKDANVQYEAARQKESDAYVKLRESQVLYEQAYKTDDAKEREALVQEAKVAEQAGTAMLQMAESMKSEADAKYNEAKRVQRDAVVIVENANEQERENVVAFEKAKFENNLPQEAPVAAEGAPSFSLENTNQAAATALPGNQTQSPQNVELNNPPISEGQPIPVVNSFYTDLPTSPYSSNKPIPVDPPMPLGVVYKVQIGAFSKPIPQNTFGPFAPLSAQKLDNGLTRYYAGLFPLYPSANAVKEQIREKGYDDAFVVAFLNGNRIPLFEARKLEAEIGASAQFDEAFRAETNRAYGLPESANTIPINVTASLTPSAQSNQASSGSTAGNVSTYDHLRLADVDGMFYTVQIGAFSKRKSKEDLKNVSAIIEIPAGGVYRYNSGIYDNRNNAESAKDRLVSLGFSDAFVTAYFNGKRIYAGDAQQIQSEEGPEILARPWDSFDSKTPQKYRRGGASNASSPSSTRTPSTAPTSSNSQPSNKTDGIIFKVQVGAFSSNIAVNQAKTLLSLTKEGVDIEKRGNLTIYRVGAYKKFEDAQKMKIDMIGKGFQDAFVVAYKNNKKYNLQQAIEEAKQS